jgi:hypothetical protein
MDRIIIESKLIKDSFIVSTYLYILRKDELIKTLLPLISKMRQDKR